jgi:hypothetical protein
VHIVCQLGRTFSRPQPDRQPIPVNVNAVDQLCDCTVICYGRHPALASEMFVEGFNDDLFNVCCRNACNRSDLGRRECPGRC